MMMNDQLSIELLATGYEAIMALQLALAGPVLVMLTMAQMPADVRAVIRARSDARLRDQ